jgi:hypothetical protein
MLFIKKAEDGSIVYKYEPRLRKAKHCIDPVLVPIVPTRGNKISRESCESLVCDMIQVAQSFESNKYKISWDLPKLTRELTTWVMKSS